jgi:heme oxygenase (mycobilin-producing)
MTMISVVALRLDPARIDDALAAVHETLAATRAFEGNLGVDVVQDVADPGHVLLVERWASLEADMAYRAFRASGPPSALRDFATGANELTVGLLLDGV